MTAPLYVAPFASVVTKLSYVERLLLVAFVVPEVTKATRKCPPGTRPVGVTMIGDADAVPVLIAARANTDNTDNKFFKTYLSGDSESLQLQTIRKTIEGPAYSRFATSHPYRCGPPYRCGWPASEKQSPSDWIQSGNRGIALIDTSPHLTAIVSKTNPSHHTAYRQRTALLGYSHVCFSVHQEFFVFKKKIDFSLKLRKSPFARLIV